MLAGASRYYSEKFKNASVLECKAIKLVREKMRFGNLAVMISFCRTVGELLKVKEVMQEQGLKRGREWVGVISYG